MAAARVRPAGPEPAWVQVRRVAFPALCPAYPLAAAARRRVASVRPARLPLGCLSNAMPRL